MPLHLLVKWEVVSPIVDRDSGNLYPIYPLFPCSDFFISNVGVVFFWGGGGCNVFSHFLLFPTFSRKQKFLGIKKLNFLFHLMFSSCFSMLDFFPAFLEFVWKY